MISNDMICSCGAVKRDLSAFAAECNWEGMEGGGGKDVCLWGESEEEQASASKKGTHIAM